MSGPNAVPYSNKPHWSTWLAIGISLCALAVAVMAWKRPVAPPDNYSVQTMSAGRVRAIKLNKNTGETWFLKLGDNHWSPSEESNAMEQNQTIEGALDALANTPPSKSAKPNPSSPFDDIPDSPPKTNPFADLNSASARQKTNNTATP